MFLLVIFLTGLFVTIGVGLLAAYSDIRGLKIPNLYSVLIISAFLFTFGMLSVFGRADVFSSPLSHGLGALIVFLVTMVMFALGGLGGADSKLGTAFALWVGVRGLFPFLFYMSLCGGILALTALALKKWPVFKSAAPESWVGRVQAGESKVPYGVAIVFGALASFVDLGYLNQETFRFFVSF